MTGGGSGFDVVSGARATRFRHVMRASSGQWVLRRHNTYEYLASAETQRVTHPVYKPCLRCIRSCGYNELRLFG